MLLSYPPATVLSNANDPRSTHSLSSAPDRWLSHQFLPGLSYHFRLNPLTPKKKIIIKRLCSGSRALYWLLLTLSLKVFAKQLLQVLIRSGAVGFVVWSFLRVNGEQVTRFAPLTPTLPMPHTTVDSSKSWTRPQSSKESFAPVNWSLKVVVCGPH